MREALSAELDGEDPGIPAAVTRRHLAACGACRGWHTQVVRLTRRARVTPVPDAGPDVAGRVLAAVRLPPRHRGWCWRGLRAGLLLVALAQVGIGMASLLTPLGLGLGMAAGAHMDHEEAAFNLAFAAALLLVAARPRWALAQVPLLASFVLVLAVASIFDLTAGAVGWARLATHAPIVLGLVLATALHRSRQPQPGPATRTFPEWDESPSGDAWSDVAEPGPEQQPPPPAARHDAAARHDTAAQQTTQRAAAYRRSA